MKGILIDVRNLQVREVELKAKLSDYYRLIECDLITAAAMPNDEVHDIVVDDEGLLKNVIGLFSVDDEAEPQFAGNGLILRVTPNGNWVSHKLNVEEVRKRISFWKVVYTSEGKFLVKVPKTKDQ